MQDWLLDSDGDLSVGDGTDSIVFGLSDTQHQNLLLLTDKGQWKENPDCGVGAIKYLENEDAAGFMREIRVQFTGDGMKVTTLKIDKTGKVQIEASYAN